MMRKTQVFFVRASMIFLMALSFCFGVIEYHYERAKRAYPSDLSLAGNIIESIKPWYQVKLPFFFLSSKILFAIGQETHQRDFFIRSKNAFESITQIFPKWGEAWFCLGMAELFEGKESQEGVSWPHVEKIFRKALQLEKGNLWMRYTYAKVLLENKRPLAQKDQHSILNYLKFSARPLDTSSSTEFSPYLMPSLDLLWNRFQNFQILYSIVPRHVRSLRILRQFLGQKKLWHYCLVVDRKILEENLNLYMNFMAKGIQSLSEENFYSAYRYFLKAKWAKPGARAAEIGSLIAANHIGRPSQNAVEKIKRFLEKFRVEDQFFLNYLGDALSSYRDPWLNGLWHYHRRHYEEAIFWLQEIFTEGVWKNVYLALSYQQLNEKEKLGHVLELLLNQPEVPLEAILLLQNLPAPYQDKFCEKVEAIMRAKEKKSSWWGDCSSGGLLNCEGKKKRQIIIRKGVRELRLSMKNVSAQGICAYVEIRLGIDVLAYKLICSREMKGYAILLNSQHLDLGENKLVIELLNSSHDPKFRTGVQLGDLKTVYVEN